VDKSNQTAHFSNYGSKVDLLAPGVDIYSTHLNNSYKKMSGTSMATPHVTGLVSLMKQKQNNLKSTDIKSILLQSRDANTHTIHTETIFSSLGSTPIEPPKEEPKPPVEPSVPTPLPTVEGNAKVILEATINPNLKPLPDQERIEYPKFEPVIIESTGPTPQSIDY
jgi:subtilisin family serine protease